MRTPRTVGGEPFWSHVHVQAGHLTFTVVGCPKQRDTISSLIARLAADIGAALARAEPGQ
jgi:uncharacterized membrane protein